MMATTDHSYLAKYLTAWLAFASICSTIVWAFGSWAPQGVFGLMMAFAIVAAWADTWDTPRTKVKR